MVPLTVSLATIFTPDSFAKICKMVRTSTSWKSKEILRPLNDLFAFWFKPLDSVLAALGDTSNTKRPEEALVLMSQFALLLRIISWVELPIRLSVTFCTGVLKSATSKLRCACVGKVWFFNVTTTRSRCCLISGCPLKPGADNSIMPELRAPLRKSILAAETA